MNIAEIRGNAEARAAIMEKAVSLGFQRPVVIGLVDFLIEELAEKPQLLQTKYLSAAGIIINTETREFSYHGKPLDLTATEQRIVEYFVMRPGILVPMRKIVADLYSPNTGTPEAAFRVYVLSLRKKIAPDILRNVFAEGYIMDVERLPS